MTLKKKKKIVVAVTGGFDPVHIGHVRLFKAARELGDELVVILNNDNWLKKKKGGRFMPEKDRKELIESIRYVDRVVISHHLKNPEDMSVYNDLIKLKPDIYADGGDRKPENTPREYEASLEVGIKMVSGVGGRKLRSSTALLATHARKNKHLGRKHGEYVKANYKDITKGKRKKK